MILEGREKSVRRPLSLAGFVLSASLLARFRLLSKRASVALRARSLVVGVCKGVGGDVVEVVARGSSNWPGIVPVRGLRLFQSAAGRASPTGESSESEPSSPSVEKDTRVSFILSISCSGVFLSDAR